MAACGRFDADTSSVAGAADAGSADGARAPGDAAVIEDGPTASDAGTFSCAEGEGRLDKTLDESFSSAGMPDGWIQGDTSHPEYITFPNTPYADGGTGHYLHATNSLSRRSLRRSRASAFRSRAACASSGTSRGRLP